MPIPSYELTRLDPNTFEHLANMLALRVLGAGHTGFGPGPDGGRDGFFAGTAPYPSRETTWSGVWYIQSKFLAPHLTKDAQKWLLDRVAEEIEAFKQPDSKRTWPDNWIIVTNVEQSGVPQTGSFDRALELVKQARPQLADHFHIWGGRKVLDLLALHLEIGEYYGEFVTPGHVLSRLYEQSIDSHAHIEQILRYLIVTQFNEQQYTKLEQAESTTDNRPGIQRLFTDVPFHSAPHKMRGMAAATLARALAQYHGKGANGLDPKIWQAWQCDPTRARVWFVKGGPGQGKSTLTQYLCQIQRAALILAANGPNVLPPQHAIATEIREIATPVGLWPIVPRIPVTMDLKEFAHWFGGRPKGASGRILSFFEEGLTADIGETVRPGTLRRAFGSARWLFVFDGLDEVPGDVKDAVAAEVSYFVDDFLIGCRADAGIVCTSRPQGYSGQFANLNAAVIELVNLSREQALACAEPLLALDRSDTERRAYIEILRQALQSDAISEIMTTPLQAHIMAVIVRDGGRPPERRWQLFDTFYQVIKKREANRNLPDRKLAALLREGDKLLKAIHNRLGFELHARAETSQGAVTSLARSELRTIVAHVVSQLQDTDVDETVATLMRATTERLVLVSTPEAGDYVRFDIRPLQEFFAAEHIYQSGEPDVFVDRVRVIAGDSHWREVMHFLLSALVEQTRKAELAAAVMVLSQIDDAGDAGGRALSRRLARGGIMAARLLQEGVLEQDKRVREQFRGCILPLLGCVDAPMFLSNVRGAHSLSWLRDVLLANLREQAERETVGAVITLARMLGESDRSALSINEFLAGTTLEYQGYFCENIRYYAPRDVPAWVVDIALRVLLRTDWHHFRREAINAACDLLKDGQRHLPAIGAKCGLRPELIAMIPSILFARYPHEKAAGDDSFNRVAHHIVETKYLNVPKDLDWARWPDETWRALETSTGIFQSVYRVLDLLRKRDADAITALLTSVGGSQDNLSLLPQSVRHFLSDYFVYSDTIQSFTDIDDLLQREYPGCVPFITRFAPADKTSTADWISLAREEPYVALYMLAKREGGAPQALTDELCQVSLLESLTCFPALFHHVPDWGTLFELSNGLGPKLRGLAIANSKTAVHPFFYGSDIKTFQLDLPKEAGFLPHLVGAIIERTASRHVLYVEGRENRLARRQVQALIEQYVFDPSNLRDIAHAQGLPKRVRGAAMVFFHLHPKINGTAAARKDQLIDFYDPAESDWYLPAVAFLMTDAVRTGLPEALDAIGSLIDHSNADYSGRSALNSILRDWREFARAPVHQLASPELWL